MTLTYTGSSTPYTNSRIPCTLFRLYQTISPEPRQMYPFRNKASFLRRVVRTSSTPKLEDHPLSAAHNCLFNIFTATLHTGGLSSIRSLRTRHAVMTGTHLATTLHGQCYLKCEYLFQYIHHRKLRALDLMTRGRFIVFYLIVCPYYLF